MSVDRAALLEEQIKVGEQVLKFAREAGASQADTMLSRTTDFEVKVADGRIVTLTQAVSKAVGARVFVDGRLGLCSTSDFSADNLKMVIERAVAMAKQAEQDEFNGLAEAEAGRIDSGDDLDLFDPAVPEIPTDDKIAWAHALETSARASDKRVTKFRDSGVSSGDAYSTLLTSDGAIRTKATTGIAYWCTPIAEQDGELQVDFWYDSRTHLEDIDSVEKIGALAGQRAARMLGAKPIPTCKVPVIFEPSMAGGLVGGILGAIDGDMIHKKTSFLMGKLGERIASPLITYVDDPLMKRGPASAPFDGEAMRTSRKALLDKGVLTTYLWDSYTARKAGEKPTGNGRRGPGSSPVAAPFNTYIEAGDSDPQEIWSSVPKAFVMTRGLGSGVDPVTGDYSRGANGLLIENGEIVGPVQEVTIAGNYIDMLNNIDRVGNDLLMRGSSGAPTIRVAEMTVSGT